MSTEQVAAVTATTERLLRLAEIQKAAGVSRVTLYRWTHERGLKTIRVGGCVRVREGDWQKWLSDHASEGVSGDGDES